MSDYLKEGMERTYDTTLNGETIYRDVSGNESYEDSFGYLNPIEKPISGYGANDEFDESGYGETTEEESIESKQSINPRGYKNDPDLYINGSKFSRVINIPDDYSSKNKKWHWTRTNLNNNIKPMSKSATVFLGVFMIIAAMAAIWVGFHVIKSVFMAFVNFLDQIW